MRIAFLTDIHIGATPAGWQQQPRWCEGIDDVLAAARERMKKIGVDLVMYGGDLVEEGTRENIEDAVARLDRMGIPSVYCLGNHDLTAEDSLENWRRAIGGRRDAHM